MYRIWGYMGLYEAIGKENGSYYSIGFRDWELHDMHLRSRACTRGMACDSFVQVSLNCFI